MTTTTTADHALELRPYQSEGVQAIQSSWSSVQRLMYELPTGAGKTEIAIVVIKDYLAAHPNAAVVWLTHRFHLRDQSRQRIAAAGIPVVDLAEVKRSERQLLHSGVAIMTPALTWVQQQVDKATEEDLLVVDEAHHSVANSWVVTQFEMGYQRIQ